MTANEYAETIFQVKKELRLKQEVDLTFASDVASLISGNFTQPLDAELWTNF